MLYPRVDALGKLVSDDQMVGHREHLTQQHRVLFLSGVLTGETESHNLLLALDSLSSAPIRIVITSPGGDLDSAFLFYDTMQLLRSPVYTVGRYCASAAALLLAAGQKRYLFPHAKVMLHTPKTYLGSVGLADADLEVVHKEAKKYKAKMAEALIACGVRRTATELLVDIERADFWLEPEEAIKYGLADEVMTKKTLEEWLRNEPDTKDN